MTGKTTHALLLTALLALPPLGAALADDDWMDDDLPPYAEMYGPGPGPGAMMGYGMMGPMGGMRHMAPFDMLDLTDQQERQIDQIRDKLRKDHWQTEGKMIDARAQLRDAWAADRPDPKKVGAAYEALAKLRREMIEADVAAMNQMRDALTEEQREKLKRWYGRAMMQPDRADMPHGGMHGRMMR
jgi:Spy/CpxP family protein refolding chaperone